MGGLEKVYTEGDIVKSIGMCNCRLRHLREMEKAGVQLPDILQVEVTPLWQIKELYSYCQEKDITVQAFSPLCKMIPPIAKNPILIKLARKHNVSIPQIILRWDYQRGISPISLTGKVERVKSNFDIYGFSLSTEDMALIATLDCGYKYHLESATCWGF